MSGIRKPRAERRRPTVDELESLSRKRQEQLILKRELQLESAAAYHPSWGRRASPLPNLKRAYIGIWLQQQRKVTLEEGVALSFGYEPRQPDLMRLREYPGRVTQAIRHFLGKQHKNWDAFQVDLIEFATWAKSVGWSIPWGLGALATESVRPELSAEQTPSSARAAARLPGGLILDKTTLRLQKLCENFEKEHGEPPSQRALEKLSRVNRKAIARRKTHLNLKLPARKRPLAP